MNVRPIDTNRLDLKDFWALYGTDVWESELMEWINERPTLSLNTLRDAIYQDAVEHGLWEDYNIGLSVDLLAECHDLICDEVDELDNAIDDWANGHEIDRFNEELADVVIMCFSVAGYLGIDIDAAIRNKMEVNKRRPWKHEKVGDI